LSHDVVLAGCVPSVLAGYLKALGVHRLVAEQLDPAALSYWDADGRFHLVSSADASALVAFFVERYEPTPIVTPWNGGSGFYAGDQLAGIDALRADDSPRFVRYRETIARCSKLLVDLGILEKPRDEKKQQLLQQARAHLPDEAVRWLDAVYVVGDSPAYPPILGTGGNDGRLDFANNFMQRVAELLLAPARRRRGEASAADKLRAAVLGETVRGVYQDAAVGQFAPALAGGPSMGSDGMAAESRVNAWDYVLALEGALLFAGAAVRRLDSLDHGRASFPFHVTTSAVGYGSSAASDAGRENGRAELWLPCWPSPTGLGELTALFGEGRLEIDRRRATSGLDAARAIATLGVDRGIDRFERVAILKRNGLSFLATTQGTIEVRAVPKVELLRELDPFIGSVLRLDNPGHAVSSALRALQAAMFEACRGDGILTGVLAATGALERAVARSAKARDRVRPLRRLGAEWIEAVDDGSTELAVAAAVASWDGFRRALEPVDEQGRWDDARPAWTDRDPLENIAAVARRRLAAADRKQGEVPFAGHSGSAVTRDHLRRLLLGAIDGRRLTDLIFGLALVERAGPLPCAPSSDDPPDDAVFAVLRAVTSPWFLAQDGPHPSPKTIAIILGRLAAHDVDGALELAERRLRSSNCPPKAQIRQRGYRNVGALAAALVIPLPRWLERKWIERFIRRESHPASPAQRPLEKSDD
jgi:CRISPR-associated protein Csx17